MEKLLKFLGVVMCYFIGVGIGRSVTSYILRPDPPHHCSIKDCEYTNMTIYQYKTVYAQDEGTDQYYIVLEHLKHPDYDYEQLETAVFGSIGQPM